ncbi:hypothetical protein ACLB2K_036155 [Fragaria x ananassa]
MDRVRNSSATESETFQVVVDSATNGSRLTSHASNADEGRFKRENLVLAYKTLGVVFGGLVTSPLYVYPSMPLKSPTEDDYLGIYSIMFWTLTLIGVVKYAGIALKADDQGEGGTFALYSLLCRNMDIGILSSRPSNRNFSLADTMFDEGTEKQSRLAKFFKKSIVARRLLLFIAMLGMCMVIGDGILTPAISVLSAIDGVRAPFPSLKSSIVEALSAVVLIILFLLQKFGTSRAYSRLYHHTISSVSFGETVRKAGCCLVELSFASQGRRQCLQILVISTEPPFR